jgi:hypothetical protein
LALAFSELLRRFQGAFEAKIARSVPVPEKCGNMHGSSNDMLRKSFELLAGYRTFPPIGPCWLVAVNSLTGPRRLSSYR